jgi:aldehyde dehydrogenase (NAD+)
VSIADLYETLPYGPAPESADLAQEWLERHDRSFGVFVGGKWTEPAADGFETLCPANGKPLARISQSGSDVVDAAVRAAKEAQPGWAALSGHERARFLYAIARRIQRQARLFAVLESMDNGKPIRETRDIDIPLVARHFYYHAGWAQLSDTELEGHEPLGVCGQIIPWNFPLLMLAWKIAPALATGNTVVLKPAEFTPLTALLFAEICEAVQLPAGVVNIITGDGETGRLLVEHPDVGKIAFTGSTEVGRIIRRATAGTGKKLSLELGGKSPFVIFEDADLDSAVEGVVDAIWFNQGQVCCAGSRLLVQEGIEQTVVRKIRERMEKLRVGDPLDKAVDIGAIIAPVQLERIAELVAKGQEEGAELFQPSWACPQEGWFYPPTLLTNVGPASTVAQVEIFGPVLVAMTFRTPEEAIALANNTVYGLAASVWSENLNQALYVATNIKAGTIWVNCTNQFDASSGFGGYRESGFGREGGREGLMEYLKPRRHEWFKLESGSKPVEISSVANMDRTHKQFVGGKQVRPDGGYSYSIALANGDEAEFARGNRKDVRNAVEAALKAQPGWAKQTAHARAQILFYIAENLAAERAVFERAAALQGLADPAADVDLAIRRLFDFAAWADKHEGVVHPVPMRGMAYTVNEPLGIVGIVCPNAHSAAEADGSLAVLCTLIGAAVSMGNATVVLPSDTAPLAAAEMYRLLEMSDVPAGVVNILTGPHAEMDEVLAAHDGVDSIWSFGAAERRAKIEAVSAGNLKQVWSGALEVGDREILRRATQVKNVWVPHGE